MKILMLTGSISRQSGGLFNSVRMLSKSLANIGVDVRVIGLQDEDALRDYHDWHPIKPIILNRNIMSYLSGLKNLYSDIKEFNPDIIHMHGIWSLNSIIISIIRRRYPVVISPRGMLDPWAIAQSRFKKEIFWNLLEKRNIQKCTTVHALCDSERNAIADLIAGRVDIITVPNGINIPPQIESIKTLRNRSRYQSDKFLLSISRLHPKKGLLEMIEAYAVLPDEIQSQFRLKLAGPKEGNYWKLLNQKIIDLGLVSRIELLGPTFGGEKEELLINASAFILPSKSEGLPMAILEAWSYGLPVIMTKECNLQEAFGCGAAYEISSSFCDNSFYDSLIWLQSQSWNSAGFELVESTYLWSKVAAEQLDLYNKAVKIFSHEKN